jgi:hypothetical protein
MIKIHAKRFDAVAAIALLLAVAASGSGHAEFREAGQPAHVNAPPRPPLRPPQARTVVAAPIIVPALPPHIVQAPPPRIAQPAPSIAMGRTEDTDHGHDRAPRDASVIVGGVPSVYYYGAPTFYAPGYYGDQYSDGGPAVGPAPPADTNAINCAQTYSSYDPQSGTYIGNDGNAHPCP